MVEKKPGGVPIDKECLDDTTQALVDVFNIYKPDLFVTFGHATERDWQIGYSFPNGQFRCRDWVLYGVDRQKKWIPINSPNPKVNIAVGNCLVGHIPDTQALALAYMGSGGVTQMVGYTVETWFGYGGWGVNNYFLDQPGRYSLAEAFYLNNQALVHQLQSRFPDKADFEFNDWGHANQALDALVEQLGVDGNDKKNRDLIGLLWDRDTVAFYGDPAWDARLNSPFRPMEPDAGRERRRLHGYIPCDARCGHWPSPGRVSAETGKKIKVLEGTEWKPVITDNFLLLTGVGKFYKGKVYTVKFRAEQMDTPSPVKTSKPQSVSASAVGKPVAEERLPEVARAEQGRAQSVATRIRSEVGAQGSQAGGRVSGRQYAGPPPENNTRRLVDHKCDPGVPGSARGAVGREDTRRCLPGVRATVCEPVGEGGGLEDGYV